MSTATGAAPVVLIAARERSLESVLVRSGYRVVWLGTGTLVLERTPALDPDSVILGDDLPDITAIDACRGLHSNLRVGPFMPILVVSSRTPTPEQRAAALLAGAWDYLPYPARRGEFLLRLQAYVQAKRKIDAALTEGLVDPATGVCSRPALARRARELGALMSRAHGALCCVVFSLEGAAAAAARLGSLVARSAREYDVVGALSPTEFAVLAPATDEAGAVVLAERIAAALRKAMGGVGAPGAESRVTAGYDVVANLTYAPIDPVDLLRRARGAVRYGRPEPGRRWLRRFDPESVPDAGTPLRITPPSGMVARDPRKTQPRSRPPPGVD